MRSPAITALLLLLALSAPFAFGRELSQVTSSSSGAVTASSCAYASAKSTYGSATAHASANSAAIVGASQYCADRMVYVLQESCKGQNVIAGITAASQACAAAFAEVYVKTVGTAKVSGTSRACAQACANAYGYAKSTAEAIVKKYDSDEGKCAEVSTYLKTEAFAEVLTKAYANAWSYACADARKGTASASTVAEGWLTVTASAFAKAFGNVVAESCTKCSSSCKCRSDVKYGAESSTDVYSEVTAGTYAMTSAVADAGAIFCKYKDDKEKTSNAVDLYLRAYADICIKVYGKLYAKAETNGKYTYACSGVFASYTAAAEAVAEAVSHAWASNYNGFCASVFSYVEGSIIVKDAAKIYEAAYAQACSENGGGKDVDSDYLKEYITKYKPLSEAVGYAYSMAANDCPCPDPYLCCSTCDKFSTCPAY